MCSLAFHRRGNRFLGHKYKASGKTFLKTLLYRLHVYRKLVFLVPFGFVLCVEPYDFRVHRTTELANKNRLEDWRTNHYLTGNCFQEKDKDFFLRAWEYSRRVTNAWDHLFTTSLTIQPCRIGCLRRRQRLWEKTNKTSYLPRKQSQTPSVRLAISWECKFCQRSVNRKHMDVCKDHSWHKSTKTLCCTPSKAKISVKGIKNRIPLH